MTDFCEFLTATPKSQPKMHPLANCCQARCCLDQRLASASWQKKMISQAGNHANPNPPISQENLEKHEKPLFFGNKKKFASGFFPGKLSLSKKNSLSSSNLAPDPRRSLVTSSPAPKHPRFAGKTKNTDVSIEHHIPQYELFHGFFSVQLQDLSGKVVKHHGFWLCAMQIEIAVNKVCYSAGSFIFLSRATPVAWFDPVPDQKLQRFHCLAWARKLRGKTNWMKHLPKHYGKNTTKYRTWDTFRKHEKRNSWEAKLGSRQYASCWRPPSWQRTQPGPRVSPSGKWGVFFPQ